MANESWESCKHAMGDLDIDTSIPQVKLVKAILQETEEDELLKKEGINRFYYCKCSELINLEVYRKDGMSNKDKGRTPIAQLFHLDISGNERLDLLGNDKYFLEEIIRDGLRMCAHCKFYEPAN